MLFEIIRPDMGARYPIGHEAQRDPANDPSDTTS
jgi:hypothetical protein